MLLIIIILHVTLLYTQFYRLSLEYWVDFVNVAFSRLNLFQDVEARIFEFRMT